MTVRIGLFGAGRIGRTHARAVSEIEGAALAAVFDPVDAAAEAIVARTGARRAGIAEILADRTIDAVIIGTPTDLHAAQIEQSARAGKAIFCEKPIDLEVDRARACLDVVRETGAKLMVGFNRRFDPNFVALRARIDAGALGEIALVQITSRDPAPPPIDYVRRSGGLFRDMMIHDFDMARFLLGEEVTAVQAAGSVQVDPAIGAAGDIDTAAATLVTASGRIAVITNSRRAAYGYDQRIEVLGSTAMAAVENLRETTLTLADAAGFHAEPLLAFFMERYREAYRLELTAFVDAVANDAPVSPDGEDGLIALELATAARRSLAEGRMIEV